MAKKQPKTHDPYKRVDEKFMRQTPTIFNMVAPKAEIEVKPASNSKTETKRTTKVKDNEDAEKVVKMVSRESPTPQAVPKSAPKKTAEIAAEVKDFRYRTATDEKTDIRYRTAIDEKIDLQELAMRFSARAKTKVELAKLLRPLGQLLLLNEVQLMESLDSHGLPKRPRNEDKASAADFDHRIGQIVLTAMKKARQY